MFIKKQGLIGTQKRKTPLRMRPEAAMDPWYDQARKTLVKEKKVRKVTFDQLSALLRPYGIEESPDQLNRKVNRGRFSAAFLLACLNALKVNAIEIPDQLSQ